MKVVLTDAAADALERVRGSLGDDLTLLIGNGCCDSTAPFLFSRYAPGPAETHVGEVAGVPGAPRRRPRRRCSTGARW